jgi:hypothetical protein
MVIRSFAAEAAPYKPSRRGKVSMNIAYTVALCTHNHADRLVRTLAELGQIRMPKAPWGVPGDRQRQPRRDPTSTGGAFLAFGLGCKSGTGGEIGPLQCP